MNLLGFFVDKTEIWHNRLCHISEKCLYYLNKINVFGKQQINKIDLCEYSVLGIQHRLRFKSSINKSKFILEYIHHDLWGPARTLTQEEIYTSFL